MSKLTKSLAVVGAVAGAALALFTASQMPLNMAQPVREYYFHLTLIVIAAAVLYTGIGLVVGRCLSAKRKHGMWGALVFVIALVFLAVTARGSVFVPRNWSGQLLDFCFYPLNALYAAVLPDSTPQGMASVLELILVFTSYLMYAALTGYLAGHAYRLLFAHPKSLEYH